MLSFVRVIRFFEQVKQEASRILWPSKTELITSTGIVVFAVFVFSLICLMFDYLIHTVVKFLLGIG